MAASAAVESLARRLRLAPPQVAAFLDGMRAGKSPYYLQRFERETVGAIDDEQVAALLRAWREETRLAERKAQLVKSLSSHAPDEDLLRRIDEAPDYATVEELFVPFKPRKNVPFSRHQADRLKSAADRVVEGSISEEELATSLVEAKIDLGVATDDEARRVLVEVLALRIGTDPRVRGAVLDAMRGTGGLASRLLDEAEDILVPERAPALGESPSNLDAAPIEESSASIEHDSSEPVAAAEEAPATDYLGVPLPDAGDAAPSIIAPIVPEVVASESNETPATVGGPSVGADDAFVPAEAIADPTVGHTQGSGSAPIVSAGESPVVPARESPVVAGEGPSAAAKPNAQEARAALLRGVGRAGADPAGARKRGGEHEANVTLAERRKQARRMRRQRAIESYRPFFDFRQRLDRLSDYRVLALNRGQRANVLQVDLDFDRQRALAQASYVFPTAGRPHAALLAEALHVGFERYAVPEAEKELRRELGERAERYALAFQAASLREYLLEKPRLDVRPLALEPGFRAGWKAVALDEEGRVLETALVHVIGREDQVRQSKAKLRELLDKHRLNAVVLGKGHAWRECERATMALLRNEWADLKLSTIFVHPAGITEYGGGAVAREELSQVDKDFRSVVTLGRRAQRPLDEWVKVGADQVAVGLHFDDLAASPLRSELNEEPARCVHLVGLELNAAPAQALRLVAGLNQLLARRIVERRETAGPFRSREELRQIAGVTDDAWNQAVGFLRIERAERPLDRTWIHPKDYPLAERLLAEAGISLDEWGPVPAETKPERRAFAEELLPQAEEHAPAAETGDPPALEAVAVETASVDELNPELSADELPAELSVGEEAAAPSAPSQGEANSLDRAAIRERLTALDLASLAEAWGIDWHRLDEILGELIRPGRDPRARQSFVFRDGSVDVAGADVGTMFTATVQRVADFGVFADVGFEHRGLVHVSKLSAGFVENPHEVLSGGAVFPTWLIKKEGGNGRFSLSAIPPSLFIPPPPRAEAPPRREGEGQRSNRPPGRQGGGRSGAPQGRPAQAGAPSGGQGQAGHGQGGQGQGGRPSRGPQGPAKEGVRPAYGGGQRPQPPRPAPQPLSPEMVEGKQPLRSFSDLKQLFEQKRDDKGKKKP